MIKLNIDPKVSGLWSGEAVLACCFMRECRNIQSLGPEFEGEITTTMDDLKTKGAQVLEEPLMQRMRDTFRAMPDMDPARYRPASEALIRRCLEKGLFRIKPLVDLNNLMSVRLRVPLGIYDLAGFEGASWAYRIGLAGEKYLTITQQPKSAEGKLVLADDQGVIGSPIADSGRAPIRDRVERIGVIAFLPFGFGRDAAAKFIDEIERSFVRFFQPQSCESRVVLK